VHHQDIPTVVGSQSAPKVATTAVQETTSTSPIPGSIASLSVGRGQLDQSHDGLFHQTACHIPFRPNQVAQAEPEVHKNLPCPFGAGGGAGGPRAQAAGGTDGAGSGGISAAGGAGGGGRGASRRRVGLQVPGGGVSGRGMDSAASAPRSKKSSSSLRCNCMGTGRSSSSSSGAKKTPAAGASGTSHGRNCRISEG